jgi:hypothetical protein
MSILKSYKEVDETISNNHCDSNCKQCIAWNKDTGCGALNSFSKVPDGKNKESCLDDKSKLVFYKKLNELMYWELYNAFGELSCLGVPEERAKTVRNGIDVFATRVRKELLSFHYILNNTNAKLISAESLLDGNEITFKLDKDYKLPLILGNRYKVNE